MSDDKIDQFWASVDKDGPVPSHRSELGPCWVWTARKSVHGGYGRFWDGEHDHRAHVASWCLANGRSVPSDMRVLHGCDNPPCVNPTHLHLGTQLQNIQEREARGRTARGIQHGKSKINPGDVRKIRSLVDGGMSQRAAARMFGLDNKTVHSLVHRKTWAHVE